MSTTVIDSCELQRLAASFTYGAAGEFVCDEFARFNRDHFGGELPPLPIVIGITAYGHCWGLTRLGGVPRISLASTIFAKGENVVRDVLLHEMLHARLYLANRAYDHNTSAWCEEITRLSPVVLGYDIKAERVKTRRIKDGDISRVVNRARDGYLPRSVLAGWPGTLRGKDFDNGPPIAVDTY
jgi:hypothetical protein